MIRVLYHRLSSECSRTSIVESPLRIFCTASTTSAAPFAPSFDVLSTISVHSVKAFIACFSCERLSIHCALDPTVPHSVSFVWVYSPCPYVLERVKSARTSVVIPPFREVIRLAIRPGGPRQVRHVVQLA